MDYGKYVIVKKLF